MLSLTKNTKLNQEEVIKKAEGFFGAGGLGLKTQEKMTARFISRAAAGA